MMLSAAVRPALPLLAAAAAWAAGCASLELPLALPERTERPPGVAIAVEEVPAEDAWRVYYSLDAPAEGVELAGVGSPFRRDAWGVAVAGAEASWRSAGGREWLCFSRPARVVSVSFRAGSVPPPEEPGLELAWSDGSRVLDTGHLLARPLASCQGEPAAAEDPAYRFTFRTGPGRAVRLPGAAAAGELRWEPPAGSRAAATWVYFGAVEPAGGGAPTLLLDPGLPAGLRAGLAEAVPRLAEPLGAGADPAGPTPLLVLVAWGGEDGPGAAFATAARPGALLASARGAGWTEEGGGERRDWPEGIARGLFRARALTAPPPEEGARWLPEAAADHLASEAAVAYGGADRAAAGRRLVVRANDCLVRLGGRNLPAAAEADPAAWSSCGAVVVAAADGALRRGTPPSGLDALFARLFEHAAATGDYDLRAFLGGLQELGAEPRAVADLRWLLRGDGVAEGDRFLQRLLAHSGVAAERAPPDEAPVVPETLAAMVARAVGRCYCGAGDGSSCDPAATGRQASSLAGEPIAADPRAAWDRLRSAIARGAALPLTLAGEEVTLFCTKDAFDSTWQFLLAPEVREGPASAEEPDDL